MSSFGKWGLLQLFFLVNCVTLGAGVKPATEMEFELFKSQAQLGLNGDLQKTRSLCHRAGLAFEQQPNSYYQWEFDFILVEYYLQKGFIDSALNIAFLKTQGLQPEDESITPGQFLKLLTLKAKLTITRASNNECEKYLRAAKRRASQLSMPATQLEIERMLAFMHYYRNDMDSAVFYINSALEIAQNQKNVIEELRLHLYLISFQKGLSIDDSEARTIEIVSYGRMYNGLLDLDVLSQYGIQQTLDVTPLKVDEQVIALKKLVAIAQKNQQERALFHGHMALALLYQHPLQNGPKAVYHINQAKRASPYLWKAKPINGLIWCEMNLARGSNDSIATILFDKNWANQNSLHANELLIFLKGRWYQSQEQMDSSTFYFLKVLKAPIVHGEYLKLQAYQHLSDIWAATGKHERAQQLLKRALVFQDSMKEIRIEALVKMKAKIQLDHSRTAERQQNALESRKSRINSQRRARRKVFLVSASILFISLVLVLIIVLYNRSIRLKRDKERALHQLKLIKSQINPHFQFNALNSIAQQVKNKSENATASVNHFASLSRKVLKQSREAQISLQEEIDLLHEYLALEKLRLKERLTYELHTPESLDLNAILLPPLVLQPLVENAVWHSADEQKDIDIHFSLEAKTLCCKISNPMAIQKANNSLPHSSLGTQLIHERIKLYNKVSNEQMSFNTNVLSENGAHIYQCLLYIPIELAT